MKLKMTAFSIADVEGNLLIVCSILTIVDRLLWLKKGWMTEPNPCGLYRMDL
jgi:hypothetical protein